MSPHYLSQKGGKKDYSLFKRKKQGKAKTHGPGLWYPLVRQILLLSLSELCEGFGEAAGGKRSSYVTHPDQTLKSCQRVSNQ